MLRGGAYRYMLGQMSPDGKWIACMCMETGDREVYGVGGELGQPPHQIGMSEDGSRIFVMYGPEIGAVASHVRVIRGWRGAG